jgi:hypothetical protein
MTTADVPETWSKRFYGYRPIPALPGVLKCVGFQDTKEAWETPEMKKAYPTVTIFQGYRGDRITVVDGETKVFTGRASIPYDHGWDL